MPRPLGSAPPEAIRIEDEVWQEAFTRREPATPRRLQAIAGGRPSPTPARRKTAQPAAAPARRPTQPSPVSAAAPAVAVSRPEEIRAPTEHLAWQDGPSPAAIGGVPGRRTVTIRGHGAERDLPWPQASRRRPPRRAYERAGFQPDRVALWAVLLGILLVVVAVISAHG